MDPLQAEPEMSALGPLADSAATLRIAASLEKGSKMRGLKVLLLAAALLAPLALIPRGNAQVSINIGVPPVCSYDYYGYAPYACAPQRLLRTGVLL